MILNDYLWICNDRTYGKAAIHTENIKRKKFFLCMLMQFRILYVLFKSILKISRCWYASNILCNSCCQDSFSIHIMFMLMPLLWKCEKLKSKTPEKRNLAINFEKVLIRDTYVELNSHLTILNILIETFDNVKI